jgi:predicted SAM-dependent methyltransferase
MRAVSQPIRLNVGSGPQVVEGWTSIDKSWGPVLERNPAAKRLMRTLRVLDEAQASTYWSPEILRLDVTKRLPWANGAVDAIYSSHFVEHLQREEAAGFFREALRTLRPGGILRLAMPDLQRGARDYLERVSQGDPAAADDFIAFLYFNPSHEGSLLRRVALKAIHRPHGWMYDATSLGGQLAALGFVSVEERSMREGACPDVGSLDTRPGSFFLEATAPSGA